MLRTRVGATRGVAAGLVLVLTGALAACTSDPVDPARAGTVAVGVDLPFVSLNGATAAGRAPGSVLVRGLVQSGFTTLAADGTVEQDASFGTVEKVADDPLTVRYTIAPTARWSDGVAVTPADLLLEWAARSGQLDEVVPELDADGAPAGDLDDVVAFGATSAALAHASAVPAVDGATLTVVYDTPVADWQVALDVNLPAHVVGRLALDPAAPRFPAQEPAADATARAEAPAPGASGTAASDATPAPGATPDATTTSAPEATSTPGATAAPDPAQDAERWAAAVVAAVQQQDRAALVPLSRVWRGAGRAGAVAADPTLTTTTGPYVLERVDDGGVEAVRNEAYAGERPAAFDRVRLRTDLDPLAQVAAVGSDELDVAAPLSTADVLAAAVDADDVTVVTGGDAVLQLVVQEAAGGAFDPAAHASAADPAAAAAELRRAFLAGVPREQAVNDVVAPLWEGAEVSDVVAAQVGAEAPAAPQPGEGDADAEDADAGDAQAGDGGAPATTDAAPERVTVRVLANTADPVRAGVVDALVEAGRRAGFDVEPVEATDPAGTLRTRPEDWDVAVVPVAQEDLPVAALAARWRTGGATNVTGHADAALDATLDALVAQRDPAVVPAQVAEVSAALVASGAVLPLVRTPVVTLTAERSADEDPGLPVLDPVPALTPGAADLTWWWRWTRR